MRTFSEYINEAKQNYIFGGTDNRNTNVMYSKKICELEQGDKLYWCNLDNNGRIKSTDNVDICKFVSLEILKSKNYKLDFIYLLDGKGMRGNTVVDKRNLDSTVNEYYNSHMSYTIIGTDLDDLLDKLKDYVKVDSDVEAARKFFEEKEEFEKTNEARQNYIFGGTDNRAPVSQEVIDFTDPDKYNAYDDIVDAIKSMQMPIEDVKVNTYDGDLSNIMYGHARPSRQIKGTILAFRVQSFYHNGRALEFPIMVFENENYERCLCLLYDTFFIMQDNGKYFKYVDADYEEAHYVSKSVRNFLTFANFDKKTKYEWVKMINDAPGEFIWIEDAR